MTVMAYVPAGLPAWLPETARLYIQHTENGLSLREIARLEGCHPSTVLRKVRAYENRRDDPLIDEVLNNLGKSHLRQNVEHRAPHTTPTPQEGACPMTAPIRSARTRIADDATVEREARRILRRLCEVGAVMAVAPDLEKAVVIKGTVRTAVVDRTVAQAFVLKDWIAPQNSGRVTTNEITPTGRSALKRLLADEQHTRMANGFAEAQSPFGEQHRIWGERTVTETGTDRPRKIRYNLAESPLAMLARRKEKDGKPFLTLELVAAGERLREDFELAQLGPRITQNWDRFLTAGDRGGFDASGGGNGPQNARDRVAAALRDLGPGLGDMVLRCCCFLEGLEAAEKRMGWSARSGKIVLRIALQRLKRHYEETYGGRTPLIG